MKRCGCLLIIVFALGVQTQADQITLTNGDRLTGKIVKSDGGKLFIKTDLLGEVAMDLAIVTAITTDQPLYVTLADGRTLSGEFSASGDKAELRTPGASAIVLERSAITLVRSAAEQDAYERSLNPGWLDQWSGGADLGIAFTSGNSDTLNVALGLAVARQTTRDKTSAYAAGVYSRNSTSGDARIDANTIRGGLRYERNLNRKWFGYGFTDLEHNGVQHLTLRWVVGGGLGYHAIRKERTHLDLMGGLGMNREFFQGLDNDRTSAEFQVGQTLSQRVHSRVTLKEQLFVFPNLSDGGQYRINFDTALVTDITRRIGWHLTLSDRYLSNPLPGFEKNDLLLTTGVKIKLGKR